MSTPLNHLHHARAALMAFDPVLAEDLLRKFEIALTNGALTRETMAQCETELSAIRELAQAAKEGVATAQQQFREILDLSRRLDTYDKTGKRKAESVKPISARKF